jgi:hypothetical protein
MACKGEPQSACRILVVSVNLENTETGKKKAKNVDVKGAV